jgi:hypothetical protein
MLPTMTIESKLRAQDKKRVMGVENKIRESLTEIGSRKRNLFWNLFDTLELSLTKRVARIAGLSDAEIKTDIDKGRVKNYHS